MQKRWNLIHERKKRKLSQQYIANLLSLHRASYNEIENGNHKPREQYQDILEELFKVPREKLFKIINEPKKMQNLRNSYKIRGDVTSIFLNCKDGSVMETLIDTADLKKIRGCNMKFYASKRGKSDSYYAKAVITIGKAKRTTIYLHRYIMGLDNTEGLEVDHINHDTLDNRRSVNLRIVTRSQNHQNQIARSYNKSGCVGVSWDRKTSKWYATIHINGKLKNLGTYENIQEAKLVVQEQRKLHLPYSLEARL